MDTAASPELLQVARIDDAEFEAELLLHLVLPLQLQRGGAHDQNGPCSMAEQQLLSDEASLDGLAEADVIGDEQVDPWHLQGTHDRVELVVLDRDAAPERRLEGLRSALVTAPQRTASRKASRRRGFVESPTFGQASLLEDPGAWLQLPDDLELFAQPVLVDRRERHQVLCTRLEGVWWKPRR